MQIIQYLQYIEKNLKNEETMLPWIKKKEYCDNWYDMLISLMPKTISLLITFVRNFKDDIFILLRENDKCSFV